MSGHYGNWEVGGVFIRRIVKMPFAIVAMAEANPTVNRLRREIRAAVGADTIEVGQSLDTALQIRRRLAANGIVAVLMDRHVGRDRVDVEISRPARLVSENAGADGVHDRRAPAAVLHRAPAARALQGSRRRADLSSIGTGPRDEAIQAAAQDFADQLSARVRARPECWYHFYRYWDAPASEHAPRS